MEKAWREHRERWARQRLLVERLVAQHELNATQIAVAAGVARSTVFRYLAKFLAGGLTGLLAREHRGGHPPALDATEQAAFVEQLRAGKFRRAKEAQAWIKARTQRTLALSSAYALLGKVGGVLRVPRKTHAKKDADAAEAFKTTLAEKIAAVPANLRLLPLPPYSPELNPVEKLGDLVNDAICNRLFAALRPLEDAILAELAPLRQSGARVAELIGRGWLPDQANAGAPTQSLIAYGKWYQGSGARVFHGLLFWVRLRGDAAPPPR